MSKTVLGPCPTWPVIGEYDVVVVGAGPGGLGAAIAAADAGARTLIVERYGFAGGVATLTCCPNLMGFGAGGRQIVGGVADRLVRELDRMGQAAFRGDPQAVPEGQRIGDRPLLANIVSSIEAIRITANRMLSRSGVARLYYTSMIGAETDGDRVMAVAVDRVNGPGLLRAKCFVDATGDADLVWRAGGQVREAPIADSMTKTLLIRVGGVQGFDRVVVDREFKRLVSEGKVPLKEQDQFMGYAMLNPGEVSLNFTLTAGSGLSSEELTRMDGELREQALVAVDWFRREIPGFSGCYLMDTGVRVGVRAGRCIVGVETITQKDVDENTAVPEPVAMGTRGYGGHGLKSFSSPWAKRQAGLRGIPWRALLPVSFSNVIAAGRAISAEPRVIDTFRLMARCMAIGQAAGVTAALAAAHGTTALGVGYERVRSELLKQSAVLS
jgi:hypothetical protein